MRLNKLEQLIHSSSNHQQQDKAIVEVHFQEILDKGIENYRRNLFLVQTNKSFLTLRNNETLWQEEIAEREAWDQTLADGIDSKC